MTALTPVFIMITVGYTITKLEIIPKQGISYLGTYVIKIALPCMLFSSLANLSFKEIYHPNYILTYALGSILAFILTMLIARKIRKKDMTTSAVIGIGSCFSNSGFIGYAILIQVIGSAAIVPVALTLVVESMIMLPIILAVADTTANTSSLRKTLLTTLGRLIKNPLIWSIVLGVLCSLIQYKPNAIMMTVIDKFGDTSGTIALLTIGGTLVGLKLKGMKADIIQIMLSKLFFHPLLVLAVLFFTPKMPTVFYQTAILLACMPMLSIYPILGIKYGMENRCAAALVATTALSFVTISLWSIFVGV
jgi:predicted permease